MIAPSAMYIEAAIDTLKDMDYINRNSRMLDEQRKEYFSAFPLATEESYKYYSLGLTVARIILLGMPIAAKNGITL